MAHGMTIERAEASVAGTAVRREEDRQPVAILVVSPSSKLRAELRARLALPRWQVSEAATGASALEHLYETESVVMLLDPTLPDLEPVEFAGIVRQQFPKVQILTLDAATGQLLVGAASPTAVAAQISAQVLAETSPPFVPRVPDRRDSIDERVSAGSGTRATGEVNGASQEPPRDRSVSIDRLDKREAPISRQASGAQQARGAQQAMVARQANGAATGATNQAQGIRGMVGSSEAMRRVYDLVHRVAARNTTVVVTGESGTGKDLVAQAIHLLSPRHRQPFVVINCAAIPEPLLEAELFGYVKGSFTGASQSRIGRIHAAHGGTLFLDEIGDMPLALQSKILRFLEQGEVQRLGGNDNLKVDVRVVAATNADLKAAVNRQLFREDLYYRLAVFPIALPPLRERLDDVGMLAASFLARFAPGSTLSADALMALQEHSWPGNVRELRNVIERATILAGDALEIGVENIVL